MSSDAPPGLGLGLDLRLPDWLGPWLRERPRSQPDAAARMSLAIDLAQRNVAAGSGGPFGAAVFGADSGELLGVGVNIVVPGRCAIAHGEVMALATAQQHRGTHDLRSLPVAERGLELVTSAEPCGMCLGALHWSGVSRLLCAATREDVERAGFDEGIATPGWLAELEARGVEVTRELLRERAQRVLERYAQGPGPIYNASA